MPTITVDGRSLSLDGRRLWIVSGTVHYARIPRALWRPRLLAARQAGLNTIETPAVWALHEPRRGQFDFEGQQDIRGFVELAHELGLNCILRAGPFIGDGYDLGGLPSWLVPAVDRQVRTPNAEFLQAASRFFTALLDQLADLQATRPGRTAQPGPIILVQAEHEWFCAADTEARAYLAELDRYLREAGCTVPIANRNNLYTTIEGQIDSWAGGHDLHTIARQLAAVRPDQPRLILGLPTGAPDVWGDPPRSRRTPDQLIRSIAETLSAGAQPNLAPFAGGSAFGFDAARLDVAAESFATTNQDHQGPLRQAGARSEHYLAVKRIATFASSFARVLAAAEPDQQHIAISPSATAHPLIDEATGEYDSKGAPGAPNATVIHSGGAQGEIAFVFADPAAAGRKKLHLTLSLEDGASLPVEIHGQSVAWVLRNVHVVNHAILDYTNLNAYTVVGNTLVLFGPAGSDAHFSISGAPITLPVPKGKAPAIVELEGLTVVVCSIAQIDATYHSSDAVYVGCSGLGDDGRPIAHPDYATCLEIDAQGEHRRVPTGPAWPGSLRAPTLTGWRHADSTAHVDGSSVRYATIPGPDSMESLGVPDGYGWMRLTFASSSARKPKVALFQSGDRIHLYANGAINEVVGRAPGAVSPIVTLPLRKGENTIAALIDNLGRYDSGNALGQKKGVYGHLYEIAPVKTGAAKLVVGDTFDPLDVRTPVFGLRHGERTDPLRIAWTFTHRKKSPILVAFEPTAPLDELLILLVNNTPLDIISPRQNRHLVIANDKLKRGTNTIELATTGELKPLAPALRSAFSLFEGATNLTGKAKWSFAKWEPPPDGDFTTLAKADLTPKKAAAYKGQPRWWRAEFKPTHTDAPLFLDAAGLSKGHIFLNGASLARYFVATRDAKAVPPQSRYYLPEPFLKPGEINTLLLFDEHGFPPTRCSLVYDPTG